jgi:hypothetical protein
MVNAERRAHHRVTVTGPCKLYLPRANRFVAGVTINRSGGGALVDLGRPTFFEAGEHLRVGIPEDAGEAVLPAAALKDAFVSWTIRTPGRTLVGLRFAAADSVSARAA